MRWQTTDNAIAIQKISLFIMNQLVSFLAAKLQINHENASLFTSQSAFSPTDWLRRAEGYTDGHRFFQHVFSILLILLIIAQRYVFLNMPLWDD
jgi:hypothetical protein